MLAFLRPPWLSGPRRGIFQECGDLRDDELQLVAPSAHWFDAAMASINHPLTRRDAPELAAVTPAQLSDFLSTCPHGRQSGGTAGAPAYQFWMFDHGRRELPVAGGICLRLGNSAELELYYGHVGYHVFPPHRGRHFAQRAVQLLLPLARRHGLNPVWITCNPDNFASRRTCQRLGARWVDTVLVPANHPLYARGEVAKCRFRLD